MDSGLVQRGLDFAKRKRRWMMLLGLLGFSSFGVYKVYHSPSVASKRKKMLKLFRSLASMAEMVSDSSHTISVVSKDLKRFLESDSDEIPNSLRQISKITQSVEFFDSMARCFQSMTVGILRGYKIQESKISHFPDRVIDKLMSSAGIGFASAIVGSFARNLVLGYYVRGDGGLGGSHEEESSFSALVRVMSDDKGRVLIADCVKSFVSTAVTVYLDKTVEVNFYDEMFSSLTNSKHRSEVTDILVTLCNGAVETLVKTLVETTSKSNDGYSKVDGREISKTPSPKDTNRHLGVETRGWARRVSSTLAVPRNREFVLDVTGRVTFETVRSVFEFFVWRVSGGLKRGVNVVRDEVVERGYEVLRFVGYKSIVVLTVCLALVLHIIGNTRESVHA